MPDTAVKEPATVGDLIDSLPPPRHDVVTIKGAFAVEPASVLPAVTQEPGTLLAAIVAASRDPQIDVAKLQALMAMQERLEERQAAREFTAAFARLSAKLPRVKKNGTISLTKRGETPKPEDAIPFAKWEDMDKVIRPLMVAEGFSLSFNSGARAETGGGLVITGYLMHTAGHSREAQIPLPLDTGPGRNNLQAMGSTLSYGKRYCAEMLLNIVREGADDDGAGSDGMAAINEAQIEKLKDLMKEAMAVLKKPEELQPRILKRFKIESLDELPAKSFQDCHDLLVQTINANKEKTAL